MQNRWKRGWWRFACLVLIVTPLLSYAQSSPNVQLIANINSYSSAGYNDCWGYTAPNGREYALLGVRTGTSIVDITDSQDIKERAFIPSSTSLWKDIKTYRHYAYVVTDQSGLGLQIIDLSNLPLSASLVATYTGFSTSHNISIDTVAALLYAAGDATQPVRVLSLADPVKPVQVSSFGPSSQPIHDIYARNGRAYVSEGSSGSYSIYDMSTPASPVLLKRFFVPNGGYAHNAWLSDDGKYLMTTEETVGKTVKLWDISNLDAIQMVGQYLGPSRLAHNTHIKGKYAYISHYKDGLKIVDISNPGNLTEAGHYNTYTGTFPDLYHGAWGAFPFFASGKVLISDMERGLFIVFFAPPVTSVSEAHIRPTGFELHQNFPNPFNPATIISFTLPREANVSLRVYGVLGREVSVLIDGVMAPGDHQTQFQAGMLPSGVYFYRLTAGDFMETKKMQLIR